MHTVAGSQNEEVFKYLQGSGLNIDLQDDMGWSPLFWAAHAGRAPIVKQLIEAGVNVDAVDTRRRTALHWAADAGHTDVVTVLLSSVNERLLHVHMRVSMSPSVAVIKEFIAWMVWPACGMCGQRHRILRLDLHEDTWVALVMYKF